MPKPWEGPYFPYFPYFGGQCLFILSRHGHQNRGNRDPLNALPWWSAKTMRGPLFPLFPLRVKCQNHERVPISPISPIFSGQYLFILPKTWTTKIGEIGEIGTLSLVKCQKHERVPIHPISPKGEVPKPWYFPYFPYFQGLSFHLPKTWTTKIRETEEIGTLSWFWHFTLGGNRGNRDPLKVLALHP